MRYAGLLVPIDSGRGNRSVAAAALDLAAHFDACVTGLHVNEPCYRRRGKHGPFPVWDGVHITPRNKTRALHHDARLKTDFEERARRAGVAGEWCYALGDWIETIARHAVSHDLVVMSQHGRNNHFGDYDAPAEIALRSARPVVVWPHTGRVRRVGERVVLAWNGSREAVSAMTGAMPLLVRAASVDVVIVNESRLGLDGDGQSSAENVARYLVRHGVHAKVTALEAERGDVAQALRSHIIDNRVDLLCMGAYGHSRLRQLALGGTTFELLRNMPVATLITG